MSCNEIQDKLAQYVFSELDEQGRAHVDEHLAGCADCRAAVQDMQATVQLLREGLLETPAPVLSEEHHGVLAATVAESAAVDGRASPTQTEEAVAPPPIKRFPFLLSRQAVGLAAAIALLLTGIAGLLLPQLSAPREKARRVNASGNLKQIGLALRVYGGDSDVSQVAMTPEATEHIITGADYITTAKRYAAPSVHRGKGASPGAGELPADVAANDVVVTAPGAEGGQTAAGYFRFDDKERHSKFGNALFADGHVKGFAGSAWARPRPKLSKKAPTDHEDMVSAKQGRAPEPAAVVSPVDDWTVEGWVKQKPGKGAPTAAQDQVAVGAQAGAAQSHTLNAELAPTQTTPGGDRTELVTVIASRRIEQAKRGKGAPPPPAAPASPFTTEAAPVVAKQVQGKAGPAPADMRWATMPQKDVGGRQKAAEQPQTVAVESQSGLGTAININVAGPAVTQDGGGIVAEQRRRAPVAKGMPPDVVVVDAQNLSINATLDQAQVQVVQVEELAAAAQADVSLGAAEAGLMARKGGRGLDLNAAVPAVETDVPQIIAKTDTFDHLGPAQNVTTSGVAGEDIVTQRGGDLVVVLGDATPVANQVDADGDGLQNLHEYQAGVDSDDVTDYSVTLNNFTVFRSFSDASNNDTAGTAARQVGSIHAPRPVVSVEPAKEKGSSGTFLGDLPVLGRLFRKIADERSVTAQLSRTAQPERRRASEQRADQAAAVATTPVQTETQGFTNMDEQADAPAAVVAKQAPRPGQSEQNVLVAQGDVFLKNGRYADAREHYEQALLADPHDAQAIRGLRGVNAKLQEKADEKQTGGAGERLAEVRWKWSEPVTPLVAGGVVVQQEDSTDVDSNLRDTAAPKADEQEQLAVQVAAADVVEEPEQPAAEEKKEEGTALEDTDDDGVDDGKKVDGTEDEKKDEVVDGDEDEERGVLPEPLPVVVNPFVMTAEDPFSTFAIDTDTASYALSRIYIRERKQAPPAGSVRVEEFVNAFDYNYTRQDERTFTVQAQAAPSPFRSGLTLLKVGIRGKVIGREGRKPAHLVFIVDTSGSMAKPDRLPLVQHALSLLVEQLGAVDRVSLVTYGTSTRLLLEAVPASQRATILATVDSLQCVGSTNLLGGLELGYQMAARAFRSGEVNRIILCSDGVTNIGSSDAKTILQRVSKYRAQGITLTAVGFGAGAYNDALLEQLANKGDGDYVFVDTEKEARRVFVEELAATLQTIAKDVKIQVEFSPQRVRRYRLLGYENRDIADADFRNDTVDAGEVGSGKSATALYELELLDTDTAQMPPDIGTVYVRYRDVDTARVEEVSTRLRQAMLQTLTPEAQPRFFLAACAAEFAELLRGSPYVRDTSLADVRHVLEKAAVQLPLDERVQELLELVKSAPGLPQAR